MGLYCFVKNMVANDLKCHQNERRGKKLNKLVRVQQNQSRVYLLCWNFDKKDISVEKELKPFRNKMWNMTWTDYFKYDKSF